MRKLKLYFFIFFNTTIIKTEINKTISRYIQTYNQKSEVNNHLKSIFKNC
jgi:hypothetical protein